jgi:hypothetical protein
MAENDCTSEYFFAVCCCCGTPVNEILQGLDFCDVCLALLCPDCQRHHVCGGSEAVSC